ncbi:MAG TPA: PAS domain S-box protein, partial [Thermodesulfobacteriota bacterium]|nr:PAS domain S-box protein [Thermodesulfobacteriota bacterium]
VSAHVESLLASGGSDFSDEFRIERTDGQVLWLASKGWLFRDGKGEPLRMTGVNYDITERKQAEEALRESAANLARAEAIARLGNWEVDLRTNKVKGSGELYRMFDMPPDAPLDAYARKFHPDDRARVLEAIDGAIHREKPYNIEYRIIPRPGEERHVHAEGEVVRDETGAPVKFFGTVQDITQRKMMEEEIIRYQAEEQAELEDRVRERTAELIRANEELAAEAMRRERAQRDLLEQTKILEGFFTSTITPLVFLDRDFNFIRVNEAYAKTCRRNISDFPGHNHFEFYPHKENEEIFRNVVKTKTPYQTFAKPFVFSDHPEWGTTYWDWALTPLLDDSGEVEFLVFSLLDVTEEVRIQNHLRQTQKMEALGTLAGGISHDLNNVLAPIMINTELALLDLEAASPVRKNLEMLLQAVNRGKDLVKQIIIFSRQKEQEREAMKVSPIVKETLKFLRTFVPKHIEIRTDIGPDHDVVLADPSQIHQIVMNLGNNAAHAMRKDGGVLEIRLKPIDIDAGFAEGHPDLKPGPYLCLTVRDTGHGIPPEILERIFDPFFTTKAPGEGSGIGLAVVHSIVKNYGGVIEVASRPGEGTMFQVYLPRIEGEAEAEKIFPEDLLPRGTERILLVDDEEMQLQSAHWMLERLGYRVTARSSSPEALRYFKKNPADFDLVIADQMMP